MLFFPRISDFVPNVEAMIIMLNDVHVTHRGFDTHLVTGDRDDVSGGDRQQEEVKGCDFKFPSHLEQTCVCVNRNVAFFTILVATMKSMNLNYSSNVYRVKLV